MGNLVNMANCNFTVIKNKIFHDSYIGMTERGLFSSFCCLEQINDDIDIFEFLPDDNEEIQNALDVLVHEKYISVETVNGKNVYKINNKLM